MYATGPERFPNIGQFKVYVVNANVDEKKYNCFAWSIGFQDRWINGGTREQMKILCDYLPLLTVQHSKICCEYSIADFSNW